MRRVFVWLAVVGLLLAAPTMDACAQGVLDTLRQAEQPQLKAAPPSPSVADATLPTIPKDICLAAEKEPGVTKCRGYYVSANYAIEWYGSESFNHQIFGVEVMTNGNDAVVCSGQILDDWSRCIALTRSR